MTGKYIFRSESIKLMIDESRRIQRGLVVSIAIFTASIFVMLNPNTRMDALLFWLASVAVVAALVNMALNIVRLNGLNRNIPETEPQPGGLSDRERRQFESTIAGLVAQLKATRPETQTHNTIKLSKYEPDNGTWSDLAIALYNNHWKWTRDILEEAGTFNNLTSRFPEITKDLARIDILEGKTRNWKVTIAGRKWFIEQSEKLFLEHLR